MGLTGPLKWHGGKTYLARRIVDLMPRHKTYVEPYCGGAAVLLAKPPTWRAADLGGSERGVSETINDLNGCIEDVCSGFLTGYMATRHGGQVRMTVKYLRDGKLYAIRIGKPSPSDEDFENEEDCHIFQVFKGNSSGNLYIKDVNDLTSEETNKLAGRADDIRGRANSKGYATFISLPLIAGLKSTTTG